MFGINFPHHGEKIIAIADVGSDSVGVCIAKINPRGPALIFSSQRLVLQFEERTTEQTISGILSLLKEACEKTLAEYINLQIGNKAKSVSSAYAVIHSPWTNSRTSRAATAFEKEENITDAIIGELAQQALAGAGDIDRSKLFEAGVVRIDLNGYPTKKPAGKYAHMAGVAALLSECEPAIRAGVTETMQRTFSASRPILHSGTRALLSIFHEWPDRSHNHLVIDIAGDSTNCVVIRKDVAAEHLTVPEGVRTIMKRIVGAGLTEGTLSLLRMVTRDTCNTPACEQLNASLAKVEPELVRIFGEAFGKLGAVRRLPNELLLVVEPELGSWLSRFFARIDFGQFTITTQPFSPSVLAPEDLQGFAVAVGRVAVTVPLAVAAEFVNSEEQS